MHDRRLSIVRGAARVRLLSAGTAAAFALAPAAVRAQDAPPAAAPSREPQAPAAPTGQLLPVEALPAETTPPPRGTTPASPYPAEAAGRGPRVGPTYYLIRHAEDWGFLASPKAKRDRFSALKYIPLGGSDENYLSLSGDQRTRYNFSTRPGLNNATDRHEFLVRTAIGGSLNLGPAFRLYGQVQSAQIFGENESSHIPIQKNDLIVQELFGEVTLPVGTGKARVMIGRQEFFDGPRFIISPRENPNIRVSMNGARLSADWRRFRFSAVYFTPTRQGTGAFDDDFSNGETLTGINTSFVLTDSAIGGHKSAIFLDPYFFYYQAETRTLARLSGTDRRETYGARLWGRIGGYSFDWLGIKQDGRFGTRPVDAWAFSTNQSITTRAGANAPRVGFHADYASGGGNFDTAGTVRSFNFLYDATIIFSDDNYLGAINLMGIAPTFSVQASQKVRLGAEAGFYWRPNRNEAVYRGNSQPYAGTQLVDGKQVASIYRGNLTWAVDPHLSVVGQVNYVDAGNVLTAAGYRDNLFFSAIFNFRF